VLPIRVAAPLVPVVVNVNAPCFELNALQSALLNAPLFVADAVGRLNVCVAVTLDMLKSVPLVPTAKYCVGVVKPLRVPTPVVNVVCTSAILPFSVYNVTVLPFVFWI
jgi:hypothetical protein